MEESSVDNVLLEKFEQEIWSKVPHLEGEKIVSRNGKKPYSWSLTGLGQRTLLE